MNLLFEVHITTKTLIETEIPAFEQFCISINAKPIIIELSKGATAQQPMISKVFNCENGQDIHGEIQELVQLFEAANYPISRVKIEVPLEMAELATGIFPEKKGTYFEWHGKLTISNLEVIQQICKKENAHLSKNALKKDVHSKFITIRDYSSAKAIRNRVNELTKSIETVNHYFKKEEFEYCIYDSNENLDQGWIS